ncbi:MAG: N-acetyl-gamma-glutamyl-phosphate reductase [Phycisphaerales bacterium]|nr:N-acetyl-gamma-glutamyl-phosphate reductase [Phycisphaerales bacterium]
MTTVPSGFVPVAILGPTGYTGLELIECLARHPSMRVVYLGSARAKQPRIDAEFPRLRALLPGAAAQCRAIDSAGHDVIARECRLAFLCLPHEAAMVHTPELLRRGVKVVDLSAAYRLKNPAAYEQAYGHAHTDLANLAHAVYGMPELANDTRAAIARATLVANPGCYPTAATLALVPLLRAGLIEPVGIIIDAASGVSGAGREPKPHTTLVEAGENYSAYGIGTHRHQPEINQTLTQAAGREAPQVLFVPHLLPIERGILETIYATPVSPALDTAAVQHALRAAYSHEPFVTLRDDAPTLRDVQRTNRVHINGRVVGGKVVLIAAIDNLVKGASGQAIQNANLMMGLPETAGLL